MLWSLFKIVLFLAFVAALAFGAIALMDLSGGLRLAAGGMEFNLGPLQSVIALIILVLLVWLALKFFGLLGAVMRFLNGDETAISRWFDRNREKKGYQALSDGMMALASGEGREAMYKAARAERYLQKPELTRLLTAQAAEMAGDRKKAETVYRELLTDERTRFVGVRGIMKARLEEGDTETAMKLAEKAFALKPAHGETQDILLRLQADKRDWKGARETLEAKLRHGALPRDVHRRRDAVLALSEAKALLEDAKTDAAQDEAIEANRLSPDLTPAAVLAARAYIAQGRVRYATRVIKKAWEVQPHPDLAAAFAEIAPDETPEERLKRFRGLIKGDPTHPEARMLLSELHIAAEDFPQARKALGDLAHVDPTARALAIMAAVERGEGADDAFVRGWLTRALTASRGPQWVCEKCHTVHGAWAPTCDNCGAFDAMAWTVPAENAGAMPGSTEMLPLIVGAPDDPVVDVDSDADVDVETLAEVETEAEVIAPEAEPAPHKDDAA